ncbi:hypothetical protein KI387_031871, partial [Taxus chinensis]
LHLTYHEIYLSLISHSSSYFGNPMIESSLGRGLEIYEVEEEGDLELPPALPEFEEGNASLIKGMIDINIGTEEEPKILKLGSSLTLEEVEIHTQILKEHQKDFTFSYKEMTGITPHIA